MSGYDIYILCLCFIVFTLLTVLFTVMLTYIVKLLIKSINNGLEDEQIITKYKKEAKVSSRKKLFKRLVRTFLLLIVVVLCSVSLWFRFVGASSIVNIPTPNVVLSSSMSFKHQDNKYLEHNNLNNQFEMFDLVFTHQLPDEFEIKQYDIVVYEHEGKQIIHRIIDIEEPNAAHPGHRLFTLRGDAVRFSDCNPVLYEDMKGIYYGENIPYIGSFFAFLQSPAGFLCILLVILSLIATPIAEKKLQTAALERLKTIGLISSEISEA